MLIRQPVVLLILLIRLFLQRIKVPPLFLTRIDLRLQLCNAFTHLFGLAVSPGLLGRLLLQRGKSLLDVDEVEDDIEYSGEKEGEEECGSGQIH